MSASSAVIDIDGLEVIFPYPVPYPEQIKYMTQLKLSLDAGGPCVLEMPSGTGKTVCILSLIIAYMSAVEDSGPLIYCTRTVPELDQGIAELANVNRTRIETADLDYDKNFLGIALASRVNVCINPEVSKFTNRSDVDSECRNRTFPWAETRCDYYDHMLMRPRPGVYGIPEMKEFSMSNGICPYFLMRRLTMEAQVIMCSYAYILDPSSAEVLIPFISTNAIIVFDEAHNIDDVCCEFLSSFVGKKILDKSIISLNSGQEIYNGIREKEQENLQNVFDKLKVDLGNDENEVVADDTLSILKNSKIPEYILKRAMPSSLRTFNDVLEKARKLVQFFAAFIQGIEKPPETDDETVSDDQINESITDQQDFVLPPEFQDPSDNIVDVVEQKVEKYTVQQVLNLIKKKCDISRDELLFLAIRFSKFLIQQKVPNIIVFDPLLEVLQYAQLLAENVNDSYWVFVDQNISLDETFLHLTCVDSTIAFKRVVDRFKRVVITSGTLSPLSVYPLLLGFEPVSMVNFTMSFSRRCLLPIICSKGYGNVNLSSSFKYRSDEQIAHNYYQLLLNFCKIVPDGIACFFPSYVYLKLVFSIWNDDGLIQEILKYKLIFIEANSGEETSTAFANYRKAIECGRGAVFLGVARGRVSEGVDFADQYGRCVILFGLPVRNTQSMIVQTRASFVEAKYQFNRKDFLLFDAMRAASQCVGRLLRSKNDYGIVILADRRYARPALMAELPNWITQFMNESQISTTIDEAVEKSRQFLVQMAQPFKFDPTKLIETPKEIRN
ncbi:DNA repair helicase rad15 [Histomonas meleagridis]|uniref:DNA repair helicase rad15 n=1 Tax=Histomonas meleagridis TaxID=135588 RepID=UPI003559823D|nr:DNA repair helicase rad15 [Histomonas meleagridis]KAH0802253.1 DNA repair helicase rad15 [Histomonas meleagridis]